jgi:hypothetical protein
LNFSIIPTWRWILAWGDAFNIQCLSLSFIKSNSSLIKSQAKRGFAAGAVLFDLGGNGVFWQKKGATLRGLWISEKKEILRKLTVFDDGGDLNCRSLLSRRLASIQGPSILIIEL